MSIAEKTRELQDSGFCVLREVYPRSLLHACREAFWPISCSRPYVLVVSFGLRDITLADGPVEIAPGTHRMPRAEALQREKHLQPVPLAMGDVLIRHPWALHRGTPNTTDIPRPLLTIRYVRRWYIDGSREVNKVPAATWQSLTEAQQEMMRFPA